MVFGGKVARDAYIKGSNYDITGVTEVTDVVVTSLYTTLPGKLLLSHQEDLSANNNVLTYSSVTVITVTLHEAT